jgi:hypothetical protein
MQLATVKAQREDEPIATDSNTADSGKRHNFAQKWRVVSLNNKLVVVFTGVVAIATVLYSGFTGWQLVVIKRGSQDTHDLAVAAGKQANAAKAQSEQAQAQTEKMAESLRKTDDLIREATEQAKAANRLARDTENAVALSGKQFRLMQASDIGLLNVSIIDRITSRFTISNFGNLAARNVTVRVKEDHFPSLHAMNFFRYDPLSEFDAFRSGRTTKHDYGALTKEESLETVSATGPVWQSIGHLRRSEQWSYDYMFNFPSASPPEQAVICFLVKIEWDDAIEHRKGGACELFINATPVPCQRFVMGLPPPNPE